MQQRWVEQEQPEVVMNEITANRTSVSLPVDAEHGGLRVTVFGMFILIWIIGYFALALIIPGAGVNLLAVAGGFILGYGASFLTERLLRSRWPSGRRLDLDARGVRLARRNAVEQEITADAETPPSLLLWRFETPRRSRVPKGWYVLACGLEQDECLLCVYTFMSPKDFKDYAQGERFTALKSRKKDGKDRQSGRDDLLMAGEQRRLYQAENQRWLTGAEMTVAHFTTYLDTLKQVFPEWMR